MDTLFHLPHLILKLLILLAGLSFHLMYGFFRLLNPVLELLLYAWPYLDFELESHCVSVPHILHH